MQVITSIYLQCRPDLRDEWLTGNEADDVSEGQASHHKRMLFHGTRLTILRQAQESALRQLTKFCNYLFSLGTT